jgi:hypothetical protein
MELLTLSHQKIFNRDLTRDPKKRITSDFTNHTQWSQGSLREVVEAAERARDGCHDRGLVRTRLEQIIQEGIRHAPVVDVMVQHQPHITALVWGSIRLLIDVSIENSSLTESVF